MTEAKHHLFISSSAQKEEKKNSLGKLMIFFGMASGVGKTYTMLQEARQRLAEGINLLAGIINTHGRQETEELLKGLPIIPEKWVEFKDKAFKELDVDKILEIKPQLVLIDDLAHTNAPGSKHPKRWQDVIEILDAGINVYTTLNVQHLESRKDIIESITGVSIKETVPDTILERAANIEIIDIPPAELLQRLKEGKVYFGDWTPAEVQKFFKEEHLTALREIALRFTAEKVDHDLHGLLALGKGWKTRERLMVAINSDPSSQQLIRAARQLAFELDAPWAVVYIDTGIKLSAEDQARLNKHFQQAKELGAEVMTINDLTIANGLERIVKQRSVTRLIIGRSTKRSLFHRIFYTSLVDRLVEENKQMDILILRQDKLISLYKQAIPTLTLTSPARSYWIVLGVGFVVTVLGYLLSPFIGYKAVGYIFLMGILFLSLFVGQGPILLAATLSALVWDFLFIPPIFAFVLTKDLNDIVLVLIYFFTALIAGVLNSRIRRRDQFLYQREEKIEHLYDIMQEIARSPNFQYLRQNVGAKLQALLGGEFDILVKGSNNQLIFDSQLPFLNEKVEREGAVWAFQKGQMVGWSTDTLPSAKALYFPIQFSQVSLGVLIYHPKNQTLLTLDEQTFLQSVTEKLGVYLERYVFEDRVQTQNYMRQVEKLHTAIFRSLSKGFYTPLEKILSINEKFKQNSHSQEEKALTLDIDQAVRNLRMIIDNILTISQLESGFIQFEKKPNSIKTLIDELLRESSSFIGNHPIHLHLPQHDLVFDFDFKLIKIALKNVLINALEYSPVNRPIDLIVRVLDGELIISILDEGLGISQDVMPFIFEKFYRLPESKFGGVGLGLTIVKSIIDLHQGRLKVKRREVMGTEVSIIVPANGHSF